MGEAARMVVRHAPVLGARARVRRGQLSGQELAVELTAKALRYVERFERSRG